MSPLSFDGLPVWLEGLVGATIFFGAILAFVRIIPPLWHFTTRAVRTVNALGTLPEDLGKQEFFRTEILEMLREQNQKIAEIHHETHNNDGSSLKDSQDRTEKAVRRIVRSQGESRTAQKRIEEGVAGLYDRVTRVEEHSEKVRDDFDNTHPHEKRTP